MSVTYGIEISYNVLFTTENIKKILKVLVEAVKDNWQITDQWSKPEPEFNVDMGGRNWLERCTVEEIGKLNFTELKDFYFTEFDFSPFSVYKCTLTMSKQEDGFFSIVCYIPGLALFEEEGDREKDRMEEELKSKRDPKSKNYHQIGPDEDDPKWDEWWEKYDSLEGLRPVWEDNKKCLRHIIERLKSVFPVRHIEIDEQLK